MNLLLPDLPIPKTSSIYYCCFINSLPLSLRLNPQTKARKESQKPPKKRTQKIFFSLSFLFLFLLLLFVPFLLLLCGCAGRMSSQIQSDLGGLTVSVIPVHLWIILSLLLPILLLSVWTVFCITPRLPTTTATPSPPPPTPTFTAL